MPRYRTNADGSAICRHRDLSVCPSCAAADEQLVEVYGRWFQITDPEARAELRGTLADLTEDAP